MKVFAISDLHLSTAVEKPMDIFGDGWQDHFEKIRADWQNRVTADDVVLLGGDLSWGMSIEEAAPDYALISKLPGKKIVCKGNHDYYWHSLGKMKSNFPQFTFIQNNACRILSSADKSVVVAGSRGWNIPDNTCEEKDIKIYERELIRLKLSLDSAIRIANEGDVLIALLHYPPFDADFDDTEVTRILEQYGVKYVVYGHLHGKGVRANAHLKKNGIEYFLTSCDLVKNRLVEICEL